MFSVINIPISFKNDPPIQLVKAKTHWDLGMPLFLPSIFFFVLSTTITVGFSLDHRLFWLGSHTFLNFQFSENIGPKLL